MSNRGSWSTKKISKKQVSLIKIAKAQIAMSDSDYYSMLASVGVGSSVDLNQRQFDEILERMKAGGFKRLATPGKRQAAEPKRPLMGKIMAILADLGRPTSYADSIAKRMFMVDQVRWCDSGQLRSVVGELCQHQRRVHRREHAAGETGE